ncbi:hypothetical protein [Robertkochia aurantiaca]|uniref:hypothetical protein n=1 Tax=Robertkochia aurantiaca TaxID=2873700 RepID=UPI001CCB360F|nr:hypothetical protein [Robertkochia sp. 3YJGBD-33]
MSQIIIQRKTEYINLLRKYRIYLNNNKTDKIAGGETLVIDVEPGLHEIQAAIDWCQSNRLSFEIAEGETLEIEVRSNALLKYSVQIALLSLIPLLLYNFFVNTAFNPFLYLWPVLMLVPGYFITIGRKRYLQISKTEFHMAS